MADRYIEFHRDHNVDLVFTKDDSIVTNRDELIAQVRINTCTLEEADACNVSKMNVPELFELLVLLTGNVPDMDELGHSEIHAMLDWEKDHYPTIISARYPENWVKILVKA